MSPEHGLEPTPNSQSLLFPLSCTFFSPPSSLSLSLSVCFSLYYFFPFCVTAVLISSDRSVSLCLCASTPHSLCASTPHSLCAVRLHVDWIVSRVCALRLHVDWIVSRVCAVHPHVDWIVSRSVLFDHMWTGLSLGLCCSSTCGLDCLSAAALGSISVLPAPSDRVGDHNRGYIVTVCV